MAIPDGFGSALMGGLVSTLLYGITNLQIYLYFMHYEDGLAMKVLVSVIWILDTLHISFVCHILYYYLITNYGVPTSLDYIIWSLPASVLVNVFVVSIVQCFFARQIYRRMSYKNQKGTGSQQILFVLAQFGFGIETVILEFINRNASVQTQITYYDVTPAWATIVVAEVLITVSLCVLLYDSNSRSVLFPRTKRLVNTLIIYAVNRCLLTSLVAIADLVIAIEVQDTWSIGLDFVIGKLYANSLLASLNSRERVRSQGACTVSDLRIGAVHLTTLPTLSGQIETSREEVRQSGRPEVAVIDNTTNLALDKPWEL
ncbi:hypothetical protein PISMIDRAFT_674077 [Pisolithus microcarpus 441]|uniref:DUF6534 domain-containing protein n=1 Tax=Pisolithus microcarpus 441 TaxID=765257 RepID=A0A0C9ZGA0_9AGAM|nr:hypothetical protein PISMIDRAFT_674077 [Pisolithus microcarpus 441]